MIVGRRLLLGCVLLGAPEIARAQGFEAIGIRALGMGGAFVAVADDASATYWNPAGLVTGPVVTAVVEAGRGPVREQDGQTLGELVSVSPNTQTIGSNQSRIVERDVRAGDGILHVLDKVIVP